MTSKYKLAEQCRSLLGKGDWQEIMVAVTQALASVVKQEFFNGKQDGVTEINGGFIYNFNNVAVSLDTSRNRYYAIMPATYVNLPHDYGVVSVSSMKSEDQPFIRISVGQTGLFRGLDAEGMEGNQTYYVEGTRIYFPKLVQSDNVTELLVKLAVSLDGIDDDTDLNLSPDVQDAVITLVVQKYAPQEVKEKLN